jgi:hypothetical protein
MTKELKRFEKWWDAEDDIPNDGPYTPDTPIQFAWAGWQAALAQPAHCLDCGQKLGDANHIHTCSPQRPWVGLTYKEVQEIHDTYHKRMGPQEFASMIEAKLRSKNEHL